MAVTEVSLMPCLRRTPSTDITPSLSVRRCLFGPVDHAQVRRDFEREMKSMSESNTRRWNFDFEKECPLEGRYLWTTLSSTPNTTWTSTDCSSQHLISSERQGLQSQDHIVTTTTTRKLTTDSGCVNTTTNTDSKSHRKRPSNHKITEFLRQQKPCTRSNRYSKGLRRQSRCRQTCLDKFLE